MNNLSSYCGLIDAKIRASDKDLPVHNMCTAGSGYKENHSKMSSSSSQLHAILLPWQTHTYIFVGLCMYLFLSLCTRLLHRDVQVHVVLISWPINCLVNFLFLFGRPKLSWLFFVRSLRLDSDQFSKKKHGQKNIPISQTIFLGPCKKNEKLTGLLVGQRDTKSKWTPRFLRLRFPQFFDLPRFIILSYFPPL